LKEKSISSMNVTKETSEKRDKKIFSFSQMYINSQNLRIYTAKNNTFSSSTQSRKLTA